MDVWRALVCAVALFSLACDADMNVENGSGSRDVGARADGGSGAGGADGGSAGADSGGATPVEHPPLGSPEDDPRCQDRDGDGFYASCPAGTDCHDGDPSVNPGAAEVCDDRLDNDCGGGGDDGCACATPGEERPCYPGPAGTAGKGACRIGAQVCDGGVWSACQGFVLPLGEVCNGEDDDCDGELDEGVSNACGGCGEVTAEEVCGDGVDNDCDGQSDEDCFCDAAGTSCYTGTAATRGVGACQDGTRACVNEFWGACTGSITPTAELCGDEVDNDCDGETDEGCSCDPNAEICDGLDNDCDGEIDEDCTPCLDIGRPGATTPWEIHDGRQPFCWGVDYGRHGDPQEYQHALIPAAADPGWRPEPNARISFSDPSTLCGQNGAPDQCACRFGGDFTYFQTYFTVPPSLRVDSLSVEIQSVDDGARISIFNSTYPDGVVDPGSYAYFPGGSTTDLAQYIVPGSNRVVITHVDDCCAERRISDVIVRLNDQEVTICEP